MRLFLWSLLQGMNFPVPIEIIEDNRNIANSLSRELKLVHLKDTRECKLAPALHRDKKKIYKGGVERLSYLGTSHI